MTLSKGEFLAFFLGYFFLLWALHVFLDEFLLWKPKVFFESKERFETWTVYQLRSTRSLFPKGHPCHGQIRMQKSASVRVLRIFTEFVLTIGSLYSFAFETNTWKQVFHGKQNFDNWPVIDTFVIAFFGIYLYELCIRTQYPIQWPAAAHHIFSLVAAAKVLAGGKYFTVAVWYAVCGVALQIPLGAGMILFNRFATQWPHLTRTVLRVANGWYVLTAGIGNAVGTLVIVVGYFRHGNYLDASLALICVCVWVNDDYIIHKWLQQVSEIEYCHRTRVTVSTCVPVKSAGEYSDAIADTASVQRNSSQPQSPEIAVELAKMNLASP